MKSEAEVRLDERRETICEIEKAACKAHEAISKANSAINQELADAVSAIKYRPLPVGQDVKEAEVAPWRQDAVRCFNRALDLAGEPCELHFDYHHTRRPIPFSDLHEMLCTGATTINIRPARNWPAHESQPPKIAPPPIETVVEFEKRVRRQERADIIAEIREYGILTRIGAMPANNTSPLGAAYTALEKLATWLLRKDKP